jgi:tetratricopeptide (TPR) repeat protein
MSVEELTREIAHDPDKVELYQFRAVKYSREGKPQEAISDLTTAINLQPQRSVSCFYRGCMYGEIELYQEAVRDFDIAIRLDSDDADYYYG